MNKLLKIAMVCIFFTICLTGYATAGNDVIFADKAVGNAAYTTTNVAMTASTTGWVAMTSVTNLSTSGYLRIEFRHLPTSATVMCAEFVYYDRKKTGYIHIPTNGRGVWDTSATAHGKYSMANQVAVSEVFDNRYNEDFSLFLDVGSVQPNDGSTPATVYFICYALPTTVSASPWADNWYRCPATEGIFLTAATAGYTHATSALSTIAPNISLYAYFSGPIPKSFMVVAYPLSQTVSGYLRNATHYTVINGETFTRR